MYGHQDLHWKDSRLYLGSCATGYSITPDTKYPSMWRVLHPDGSLSDIVNLTRARDGARCLALAVLNTRETRVAASPIAQNAGGVTSPPSKWQPKPTETHIPQVPCPCHAGSVRCGSNPVRGVMPTARADSQRAAAARCSSTSISRMTRSACAASWQHDARYGYGISLAMTGWHTEIPIHDAVRTANEFWLGLSRFTHIRAVILRANRGYLMSNKRAALYMRVSTDAQTVENQTRDILKVTKSLGIGTGTVQRIANELR